MALFGPVERRTPTAIAVYVCIYIILVLGSITMIYPFLLMLGASVTTDTDFDDWNIIPEYLHSDLALFCKWMDDRYGNDFDIGRRIHHVNVTQFRLMTHLPPYNPKDPKIMQRVSDWLQCVRTLPADLITSLNVDMYRTRSTNRKFAAWLQHRYHNDINAYNRKFKSRFAAFDEVPPDDAYLSHKWRPDLSPSRAQYIAFLKSLPPSDVLPVLASDAFRDYFERHVGSISDINGLLGTHYTSYADIIMPMHRPPAGPLRGIWDDYVNKRYPLEFVRVVGDYDDAYRVFLKTRYPNYDDRVRKYNAKHGTHIPDLAHTTYPPTYPKDDFRFADWADFTDLRVPSAVKHLTSVETIWRNWLRAHYKTLAAVNAAQGTSWKDWSKVLPPRAETDALTFWRHKSAIRWDFLTRNYALVLGYILFHGRALWNTLVLVVMTVLGQLTVQPLAAYGLSRFRLRYGHRILLVLLATMAFPAEVAMIPNFLLIKELGLLNTYWALVLPGLASGMGIFLLKGYFDSLPPELYEAAMIDGAGELRMFWQITIPLSAPILAVIALGAFTAAYGGFMWAFLICQKPSMWTMMVFLFELGGNNYQSVWMASLVIAAIPTLLVFIFCQNIILRGIIIPTMK